VLDGGGVTAPDQRIEAALRLIPGRLVERATYPPRTGHRNRWPVRHRGSRMRRKTLTGDRTTSGFQVRKTVRRAGEGLSRVLSHEERLCRRPDRCRQAFVEVAGRGVEPPERTPRDAAS